MAAAAGLSAAPLLRDQPFALGIARNLLPARPERRQGACQERPLTTHLGGHAAHNAYATHVTGSGGDYQIITPEGIECTFDGLDRRGQVWEVKTGYRYFSDERIIWSPDVPKFHKLMLILDEQRARCTYVAARCGRRYAYAFDNEVVAHFMHEQWGHGYPPVYYIAPP